MSRYVVTGATGFLGGVLVRSLAEAGHDVIGLGRQENRLGELRQHGVTPLRLDFSSSAEQPLSLIKEGYKALVHCAAMSTQWGTQSAFRAANLGWTARVLEMAIRQGCEHFIHISSPSVGFRFKDQLVVTEDAKLPVPVNAYAASKAETEAMLLRETRIGVTIVRPRAIYGSGDNALLPRLLRACRLGRLPLMRGGGAVTDVTHVDDVVGALHAIIAAGPSTAPQILNVSGGEPLRLVDIIGAAAAKTGLTPRWRQTSWTVVLGAATLAESIAQARGNAEEPAITRYAVGILAFSQTLDISKIARETGWAPRIRFAEGLERTFR